ncbi:hypothetical protein [Metapseudomonas boanensis]|uniref:hypothetical protein n=1 Tax=Metapseudomonas boanensis TaxID=2822138 RepID=UPI0032E87AF9
MTNPVIDRARAALEEQVASFLSNGGEIQSVPHGATGEKSKTPWARGHQRSALPEASTDPQATPQETPS